MIHAVGQNRVQVFTPLFPQVSEAIQFEEDVEAQDERDLVEVQEQV